MKLIQCGAVYARSCRMNLSPRPTGEVPVTAGRATAADESRRSWELRLYASLTHCAAAAIHLVLQPPPSPINTAMPTSTSVMTVQQRTSSKGVSLTTIDKYGAGLVGIEGEHHDDERI